MNPNYESRSAPNDASSDPVKLGHATDNTIVDEHVQCARMTISVNDKKHETGYDADGRIELLHYAVECESSDDEFLFAREEDSDIDCSDNEDCRPLPIGSPTIDSDYLRPSIIDNRTEL